ncbi:GNAT family N-acetyltransferase [Labrys wisconsinensis]|uniref:Ribosomal protein S18 acetylase RimI-like enzyme n=1 Tax=Labrys wisconsinensis TaxID=425677 RepID=A0ABU0JH37_9HYPH|nr:GNAT family N-acetyltransferase [Labrys wisconsinensis]MDQ0473606.1 ribosomal protein S18 acetylase RimI-like enzyme [Labrys wisconsinensis]
MQAVTIRRLVVADAEDFRAIRLAALLTAPEAFGSVHALEVERPLAAFAERLATSAVLGAYDGGRIGGMAGFWRANGPKDSHKGFVFGMFVAPELRGRGVGAALIAAVIAAARGEVEQLHLAVLRSNAAAIALYRAAGFAVYGIEPRALKDASGYADELLMVRILQPGVETPGDIVDPSNSRT